MTTLIALEISNKSDSNLINELLAKFPQKKVNDIRVHLTAMEERNYTNLLECIEIFGILIKEQARSDNSSDF